MGGTRSDELLVRVGVPPGKLSAYMNQMSPALRASTKWFFDIAGGFAYAVASPPGVDGATDWFNALCGPARDLGGYAIIMHAPEQLRDKLVPWGHAPEALNLMKKLKEKWDPAGILNPGDFITN